jgi:hypothetical protein
MSILTRFDIVAILTSIDKPIAKGQECLNMNHASESFASWMIAGGARYDQPDPRTLEHLIALRDARRAAGRDARRLSPLARLMAYLRVSPGSPAATDPMTNACATC